MPASTCDGRLHSGCPIIRWKLFQVLAITCMAIIFFYLFSSLHRYYYCWKVGACEIDTASPPHFKPEVLNQFQLGRQTFHQTHNFYSICSVVREIKRWGHDPCPWRVYHLIRASWLYKKRKKARKDKYHKRITGIILWGIKGRAIFSISIRKCLLETMIFDPVFKRWGVAPQQEIMHCRQG